MQGLKHFLGENDFCKSCYCYLSSKWRRVHVISNSGNGHQGKPECINERPSRLIFFCYECWRCALNQKSMWNNRSEPSSYGKNGNKYQNRKKPKFLVSLTKSVKKRLKTWKVTNKFKNSHNSHHSNKSYDFSWIVLP